MNPIQLFDAESSTFTYLLAAPGQCEAVIIDPVERHWERDLRHLERLGQLDDGDVIRFGSEEIRVLHTPGHTAGSVGYLWRGNIKPKLIDVAVPANRNLGLPHGV